MYFGYHIQSLSPQWQNLKNLLVHPKFFSDIKNADVRKHRKVLDIRYDYISNLYEKWGVKRCSLRRSLEKSRPNYTESGIDLVYNEFGLSNESSPRNKYYVRCMHDDQGTNISQQCIPFLGVHIGVYQAQSITPFQKFERQPPQ